MMTLIEAMRAGRLSEFISQQELKGVESGPRKKFDALIKLAVKAHQPQDQTSGSPVRDNLAGKKTR